MESRDGSAVAALAAAAQVLAEPGGVPALLERVVSVAVATVSGCSAATVSLADGEIPFVSASNADAERSYPSMLDLPVEIVNGAEKTKGTLTFFGEAPDTFGADDRLLAEAYTAVATLAMGAALSHLRAGVHEEQLRVAIASRDVIGQAKGLLMARESCTADEAFEILRRASQRENLKLREIAARMARQHSGD
ncbi:MAG TPA: ANTAR domain-containing protein [Acidimicrobiales bacterium]|nr:ANTAR domain-containing protein [Acidimicrobiales bacterium]